MAVASRNWKACWTSGGQRIQLRLGGILRGGEFVHLGLQVVQVLVI